MEYDTVVIYHAQCPDGTTSAWAFTQSDKFGVIKFHATSERDFSKDFYLPSLEGKHVYIVDYSYPPSILEIIKSIAASLKVIDHHKSVLDLFETIPEYCIFDMDKCAAELTWEYLYPDTPKPWFIKHIRDRDLWIWEDPNSKPFSCAFYEMGINFETLNILTKTDPEILYRRGRVLLEFENMMTTKLCRGVELAEFEGYIVHALNTPCHISECGNELCRNPKVSFSFLYRYNVQSGKWHVSLRGSREKGVNLIPIAMKYGGGGHPLSSGFEYVGNIGDLLKPVRRNNSNNTKKE
jgi:nanoRNase/pAp phosphatase (c-di-AMP/oligoRNAs hydrolase)